MTAPSPSHKTLHLTIHGRVQGVFFRDTMQRKAQKLGVTGWVRNCDDGTVEALVHGDSSAVDAIVLWAHDGPDRAQVTRVDVEPPDGSQDGDGSYTGFSILY